MKTSPRLLEFNAESAIVRHEADLVDQSMQGFLRFYARSFASERSGEIGHLAAIDRREVGMDVGWGGGVSAFFASNSAPFQIADLVSHRMIWTKGMHLSVMEM